MKKKVSLKHWLHAPVLFICLFLFGCSLSFAQSLAVMREAGPQHRENPKPYGVVEHASKATSAAWRPYLWEALPLECLRDSPQGAVLEGYQQREWKPLFVTAGFEPTSDAHALLQTLEKLEDEAIDPGPYHLDALRKSLRGLDQLRLAMKAIDPNFRDTLAQIPESAPSSGALTVQMASSPTQYAMNSPEVRGPEPSPHQDRESKYRELFRAASDVDIRLTQNLIRFVREMNPFAGVEQARVLSGELSVEQFLRALEPVSPQYQTLSRAYERYRHTASEGVPQPLIAAVTLRPGDTGNHVRDLQKRLQQEDFYQGKISGHFDAATQEALQQFQLAHSLPADGTLGQRTREWLNISYAKKAEIVAQGMKVMRQSHTRQYDRFIRVNIPQYTLEYYKDGRIEAVHRVIVGKASGKRIKRQGRLVGENHTPVLASAIEQVIINPRWYLPDRIRMELNDEAAADPFYFSRNGYVQMSSSYPSGGPRMFQRPGPTNPLGQVKFEFPNAYAVFLHDTPKKQLFQRARRDLSHGCVRVEKARELAQLLLNDDQNPLAQKAETYYATNRQTFIKLNQPVPIVIEYMPVTAGKNGHIVFGHDPYGWFDGLFRRNA